MISILVICLLTFLNISFSDNWNQRDNPGGLNKLGSSLANQYSFSNKTNDWDLIWQNKRSNCYSSGSSIHEEGLLINQDTLYCLYGHPNAILEAVDLKNQKSLWTYNLIHDIYTRIVKGNGLIFVNGYRRAKGLNFSKTQIIAIDSKTGNEVWHFEITENDDFTQGFDMAFYNNNLYVLRHGPNTFDPEKTFEIVELNAMTGEKIRTKTLHISLGAGFGTPDGPFFLTKTDSTTNEQKIVKANGNFFLVGQMDIPYFPFPNRIQTFETGEVLAAINSVSLKKDWSYLSIPENYIIGFEFRDELKIAHFDKRLTLDKRFKGIDLISGKKVRVESSTITHPYNYHKRARSWGRGPGEKFLKIGDKANLYLLKFENDCLWVYKKNG